VKLKTGTPYSLLKQSAVTGFGKPLTRTSTHAQVLIVGTGISGALIAHSLLHAGFHVCTVDKREPVRGSTPASTGLLQYELDGSAAELSEKFGFPQWNRIVHTMKSANAALGKLAAPFPGCGFEVRDSLYVASKKSDVSSLKKEFAFRTDARLPVTWLSTDNLRNQYGVHGSAAILSRHAAKIDACALAQGLLKAGSRHGLEIYSPVNVATYQESSSGVEVQTTSGHRLSCDHLILADGYEGYPHLTRNTFSLYSTFVTLVRPLSETPQEMPLIWETSRPYCYIRSTSSGDLLVGGEDQPLIGQKITRGVLKDVEARLLKKLHNLTSIRGRPVSTWSGAFIASKDSLPFIGRIPGAKNVFAALAYGANGITFSEIGANIILQMLNKVHHPLESCFALDRNF
jgi:glycine/D-amino acid oxidase-like deaminating enzyme